MLRQVDSDRHTVCRIRILDLPQHATGYDDEMLEEKDGRISLKLDESRVSKNPLSAMKLQLAGTSKIDDLKGMDHDEFMKTMMEEYDLNAESLHTDVE